MRGERKWLKADLFARRRILNKTVRGRWWNQGKLQTWAPPFPDGVLASRRGARVEPATVWFRARDEVRAPKADNSAVVMTMRTRATTGSSRGL